MQVTGIELFKAHEKTDDVQVCARQKYHCFVMRDYQHIVCWLLQEYFEVIKGTIRPNTCIHTVLIFIW